MIRAADELAALRRENGRAARAVMRLMGIVEWQERRLAAALTALETLRRALGEAYAKPADSLLLGITIADLTLKPEREYLAACNELTNRPAPGVKAGPAGVHEGAPARDGDGVSAAAVGSSPSHARPKCAGSMEPARGDRARPAGGTALASTSDRNLPQPGGPGHSADVSPQGES